MNENFNPVEKYNHWPHSVNWKMLAIGEFLIILVMLFGIIQGYA